MRICIDIEANSLTNPDKIWLIVAKDIDTGQYYYFRNPTTNQGEKDAFLVFSQGVETWVGHNLLSYDVPVLHLLLGFDDTNIADRSIDTLIISKLVNYSRKNGHSIEAYGEEFGLEKKTFFKWSDPQLYNINSIVYKQMEDYCVRDVDINEQVYRKYLREIISSEWASAIRSEQRFQLIVNSLHRNGFAFDSSRARYFLAKVEEELAKLDKEIKDAFPDQPRLIREITPVLTKHGTLHRKDFRWVKDGDLSTYNGGPFCLFHWQPFNPASHRQIIDVLHNAGWQPTDKTQTHIDLDRRVNRLKYTKHKTNEVDLELQACYTSLEKMKKYGWRVNENNLTSLPKDAPSPARLLAQRILYESRRRTLTEWLGLVQDDGRIRGQFHGIGAWTGRMSHQKPNTANIPNEFDTQGVKKLLGKELRSLWCAPKNRLLVGVDAEGIQLRIFAHLIDDQEFTDALVNGDKLKKTDPHSLNQRVLGRVCRSRQASKRFIYALLLGAGLWKLSQILECTEAEAKEALARILERYTGFARLKQEVFPKDAKRGYFIGLDGRKVPIPGDTDGERRHLAMSGYLQNGEAIIIKSAAIKFAEKIPREIPEWLLVNIVHDEYQSESPNDFAKAIRIAEIKAQSLVEVGEELNLKCPMAGSYRNDDDYTIGRNWSVTH